MGKCDHCLLFIVTCQVHLKEKSIDKQCVVYEGWLRRPFGRAANVMMRHFQTNSQDLLKKRIVIMGGFNQEKNSCHFHDDLYIVIGPMVYEMQQSVSHPCEKPRQRMFEHRWKRLSAPISDTKHKMCDEIQNGLCFSSLFLDDSSLKLDITVVFPDFVQTRQCPHHQFVSLGLVHCLDPC